MAEPITITLTSEQKATDLLDTLATLPPDLEVDGIDLGDWIKTTVRLPDLHSEITPPFMEAFLEVQRQLYQFVAFVNAGVADSKLLSSSERDDLQIHVKVSEGSSKLDADVGAALKKAIPTLIKKMNGKQVTTVIVALVLIFGSAWAFRAWLEHQKDTQINELRSKEHIETLKHLALADASQKELYSKLVAALEAQGRIGERAIIVLQSTNDALLRAASRSKSAEINGQAVNGGDAQILRATTRKAPTDRISVERMRVVSIDTEDERNLQIVLMDDQNNQHKVTSSETLFTVAERPQLFDALASRQPIWVELLFKEADGEVRSVAFLRLAQPPSAAAR